MVPLLVSRLHGPLALRHRTHFLHISVQDLTGPLGLFRGPGAWAQWADITCSRNIIAQTAITHAPGWSHGVADEAILGVWQWVDPILFPATFFYLPISRNLFKTPNNPLVP